MLFLSHYFALANDVSQVVNCVTILEGLRGDDGPYMCMLEEALLRTPGCYKGRDRQFYYV